MVVLQLLMLLAPLCYLLFPKIAKAQFFQDYQVDTSIPGHTRYTYTPANGVNPWPVIDILPLTVYLHYNCNYMRDICRNADNFEASPQWQNLHSTSGLSKNVYGYDFNTGPNVPFFPLTRQASRRDRSCPGGWKDSHPCPELDQRVIMRHDGPWWTTLLEPNTNTNNIRNQRDAQGNIIQYSNVRYSCDEFPPATWVEGGNGASVIPSPAQTRCAALVCGNYGVNGPLAGAVKAEQNWQGEAHNKLAVELSLAARNDPDWRSQNSIVHFTFSHDTSTGFDGIAASVFVMQDTGTTDRQVAEEYVTQARKRGESISNVNHTVPTTRELLARVQAGLGTRHVVHANLSYISMSDLTGRTMPMPPMDRPYRWDREDIMSAADAGLGHMNTTVRSETANWKAKPIRTPVSLPSRGIPEQVVTPLLKRATAQDLQAARTIVKNAIAESSKLNEARVAAPLRNQYSLKPGTVVGSGVVAGAGAGAGAGSTSINEGFPPLLTITDEIAAAAALVAEADAVSASWNVTKKRAAAAGGSYWMQSLARKGTVPWGKDPNYVVFRNVRDYGAVGDGVTDDTKAIKNAMTNGTRCGAGCNGSTTKNAIVYFPPGQYLISSTIPMPFGTQVIGDANTRPTLVATSGFIGLGVLSTDEYTGAPGKGIDGGDPEYYVNTANFYRQIRNIVIDIRQITSSAGVVTCLHYQVAQATSLQNVELIAAAGSSQIGMFAENGSGGQISDVTFTGGGVGLKGGNQQFTAQRLSFNGCTIGIQVIWDWGWVWKSITMTNINVGFQLVGDNGIGNIGSVSIMDSSFTNVGTAVIVKPITSTPGMNSTSVILENVALSGVKIAVADTTGTTLLGASSALIDEWAIGPTYEGSTSARTFSKGGKIGSYRRQFSLLDSKGAYFERPKPQYEDQDVSSFVHVKDLGAKGDGSTDDTAAFQSALYSSLGKILFVDAGSYILTSTVTIPSGAKIVGETWSQLVASGSYFSDASKPQVMIKVGKTGDIGNVEMQDLIFTTRGATAGVILVEWNIEAENSGSAALWDCHARVGGATGTQLTPAECPPVTSGLDQGCSAASLMMHLTPSASGYFENMWLWGGDHMIDDPDLVDANNTMVQTSVYIARGFLIESKKSTWLYATASEHSVFYQYNFNSAANIYAGMLQTESPYFQPTPAPPAPFAAVVGVLPGDPNYTCAAGNEFSGCDESWSVIMKGSENIFIAGAGIYSWFSTYSEDCIDKQLCQKALMLLQGNFANIRIQNLVTIGAKYMAIMDGKGIPAIDNLNVNTHPDWSQISILDVGSNGTQFNNVIWIDPKIWNMDQPQFTCSSPCNVKIPPWTGATSTVNYPLLTVSDGTWTSTITQAPLTITEWMFDMVTLTEGSNNKEKRSPAAFMPVPATTPFWPAVVYKGQDGKATTTSATIPFPKPPLSIGPDAAPPPSGNWPKRLIQPVYGWPESPLVPACSFLDPDCIQQPWVWGDPGQIPGGGGDEENYWDSKIRCPPVISSSSSSSSSSTKTTTATTTQPTPPEPSPLQQGDPSSNEVKCYNFGEQTEHVRMVNAADSFCNDIHADSLGPGYARSVDFPFDYNGGWGTVTITISLKIKPRCSFTFNKNLCMKYLSVPTDSCNCGGINGKQGGVLKNNCYTFQVAPNYS
ncbi:glycoside hydrolase family 55 protein [Stipitochalara longipes BDJ]|nr:glycoside hydrolase family 55 protein [Stipitochalara longipes BDJ]